MEKISKIVFIGAGNVATNLAIALHNKGIGILQVVSRTIDSASELALKVNAGYTDKFSEISQDADLYVISVTDAALKEISNNLQLNNKIVVHTSGTTELNILKNISENIGVFYPLQTFSKSAIIDFRNIPVCIESDSYEIEALLIDLAKLISENVQLINSEQRKILHISAVFACNFSSYMYLIADDILKQNNLSFDLLKPLIEQTALKIRDIEPESAITGPSRRNDTDVINTHIAFLENTPEYAEIYILLSSNIIKYFYDTKK